MTAPATRLVTAACVILAAGALAAALPGALSGGVGAALGPVVESARGESVTLYGRGVYEYDSRFLGAGNRATDAVVVLFGLPLLGSSLAWYRRGSRAGAVLLLGTLGFFLYVYASYAIGVAYNRFFLLYIINFATALIAVAIAVPDVRDRARGLAGRQIRSVGWFMYVSAAVLLLIWAPPLVAALVSGDAPPRLDTYTTYVTYVIDLGVIFPIALAAAVLVLRGRATGYVLAASVLVIEVLLAPLIALQTWSQVKAGEQFTTGEAAGPIGGFVVLALAAAFVLASILRAADRPAGASRGAQP